MVFGFGKDDEDKKKQEEEEEAKKKAAARRRQEAAAGKDGEEESKRPGRPERPGRADAAEEAGKPAGRPDRPERPGRPGRHDAEEEPAADAHGRPERPGRPGRHDAEEEPAADAHGRPERPGRPGRHDAEEEPAADAHGRPERPGRPGRHDAAEEPAADAHGRPERPGRHDAAEEPAADAHGRPERPGRPGRHDAAEEPAADAHGRPERPGRHDAAEEPAAAVPAHGRPERPGRHDAAALGRPDKHEQQTPAPSSTTPMEVDNSQASEAAKIEAQRKKDEEERIRLQKIADNQPQQPQQQPHKTGGGDSSCGGTVTVKEGESIQAALDHATPGTTILIEAGTYNESIKSRVDGTKEQPITIKGPSSGATAIIKGDDKSGTCVEINHDYYILDDFTIDGQIKKDCRKDNVKECFREKCLAIRGTRNHRSLTKDNGDKYVSSVDGVVVKNMKIYNCGGEGIRLRYFVTNCTLFHNRIVSTGCFDFKFGTDQGIKNGEGIYIGTSSKQWDKNLTGEQDICRFNRVYENYIDTQGNECVDVKEGTMDTIIETNYCTGQKDEDSAGIDSRANGTIIRYNKVVGCKGAGVRLGGSKVGNDQYGIACKVYCNILEDNEYGGIKVMTEPHEICQNTIKGKGDKYKEFRGDAAKSFEDGNGECPFDVKPPTQDIETTSWFQNCKP